MKIFPLPYRDPQQARIGKTEVDQENVAHVEKRRAVAGPISFAAKKQYLRPSPIFARKAGMQESKTSGAGLAEQKKGEVKDETQDGDPHGKH